MVKYRVWIKSLGVMADVLSIDFEDETVLLKGHKRDTLATFDQVILLGWTGLKDKKDVEIYESDVLRLTDFNQKGIFEGEVIFAGGSFCVEVKVRDQWKKIVLAFETEKDVVIEKIGNAYENPELSATELKGRGSGCK